MASKSPEPQRDAAPLIEAATRALPVRPFAAADRIGDSVEAPAPEQADRLGHDFGRLAPPGAEYAPPAPSPLQAKLQRREAAESVLRPSGAGQPLPNKVRGKMESSFGQDFSGVRVHQGPEASSIGAVAYTRGSDIHFAPGAYNPSSSSCQQLLGHELTHVVQQRAGRVRAPAGARIPINADRGLEREADVHGAKAARGEPVG